LQRPSWWTARHALWVLAGTVATFCASLAWVVVLRRQVQAQAKIIAQKIQREAALEERTRIARDLHDDLGASLTHIGFLSEVARKEKQSDPAMEEHLREISGSTQEAFQALDEIVWVVNPKNDTLDGLTNYICQFADHFFRGTPTRCRFDLPTSLPDFPIPTALRNNLFFAVKEALNNVRKHSGASEVILRFSMSDGSGDESSPGPTQTNAALSHHFCIGVEDNDRSFEPSQISSLRNGLINMRQRLEQLGGSFNLESSSARGTKVCLAVPL